MFEHLDPKIYGAKTDGDIGVFLIGAAVGGIVDAAMNTFGFASPLVVAGLGGAGALGLKKSLVALFSRDDDSATRDAKDKHRQLAEMKVEAVLLEARGDAEGAASLRHLAVNLEDSQLSADDVRNALRAIRDARARPERTVLPSLDN